MTVLKFGKYAGQNIQVVPGEYLEYLIAQARKTIAECGEELERREAVEEAAMPVMERMVELGYREMAKRSHPDLHGGDGSVMREVNNAIARLREALRVVVADEEHETR